MAATAPRLELSWPSPVAIVWMPNLHSADKGRSEVSDRSLNPKISRCREKYVTGTTSSADVWEAYPFTWLRCQLFRAAPRASRSVYYDLKRRTPTRFIAVKGESKEDFPSRLESSVRDDGSRWLRGTVLQVGRADRVRSFGYQTAN